MEEWEEMDVGGRSGQGYAPWPLVHTSLVSAGQQTLEPQEARALQKKRGAVIVDVRTAADFARGHIEGAVNVPMYRPVEGRAMMDNAKRLAMAFFAMQATERNPDFVGEAQKVLPRNRPLILACNIGGSLDVTIEKVRNGKVVKSFEDKERVFGWESRSLKACHELRSKAGFKNIFHLKGGLQSWKAEGIPAYSR